MQHTNKGFTIIEVLLFVAISGVLTVSLMIGVSSSINRQQYRDAVQSFAGFLRSEYSKVISVQNNREGVNGTACSMLGAVNASRGQSDCVIVGRYIQTMGPQENNYGRKYTSYAVYARNDGNGWKYARTDGSGANKNDITEYEMNWGAKTKFSSMPNNMANIAILIYRDPDSGNVIIRANSGRYTSGIGSGVMDMTDFIRGDTMAGHVGNTQLSEREICVYDDRWMVGERVSIFLSERASSANAISVAPANLCKGAGS